MDHVTLAHVRWSSNNINRDLYHMQPYRLYGCILVYTYGIGLLDIAIIFSPHQTMHIVAC